jgi:hypothetical protein
MSPSMRWVLEIHSFQKLIFAFDQLKKFLPDSCGADFERKMAFRNYGFH